MEKSTQPKVGDKIKITWLPNPRNHPFTKSCYIGSEGTVDEVWSDGSFHLNMNGAGLIVGKRYKYTIL